MSIAFQQHRTSTLHHERACAIICLVLTGNSNLVKANHGILNGFNHDEYVGGTILNAGTPLDKTPATMGVIVTRVRIMRAGCASGSAPAAQLA